MRLQRVAATLQTFVTRPQDVLARYGGEEFAAVFYDVEAFDAQEIAERMRRAVGTLALDNLCDSGASAITISLGVAVIEPSRERRTQRRATALGPGAVPREGQRPQPRRAAGPRRTRGAADRRVRGRARASSTSLPTLAQSARMSVRYRYMSGKKRAYKHRLESLLAGTGKVRELGRWHERIWRASSSPPWTS